MNEKNTSKESDITETVNEAVSTDDTNEPTQEAIQANVVEGLTEAQASLTKTAHSVEELSQQLAEATQKAEDHWNNLLRKQAEYDNLQKRMLRDLENTRKYALEKFATELLTVKDSMELGLEAATKPEIDLKTIHDGMTLTLKMLSDTLAKFDVVEINPIQEKFDPQWHEAMTMQTLPNVEDGIVLHIHQKGYQLNDRLLRPARVVVAKAAPVEKPLENQG